MRISEEYVLCIASLKHLALDGFVVLCVLSWVLSAKDFEWPTQLKQADSEELAVG